MLVSYLLNITAHTVRKISQKIFTNFSGDPGPVCDAVCERGLVTAIPRPVTPIRNFGKI